MWLTADAFLFSMNKKVKDNLEILNAKTPLENYVKVWASTFKLNWIAVSLSKNSLIK